MSIKQIATTITLQEFNNRFLKENQGYKDSCTNKIYFCPHDLGFKIDQKDCLDSTNCKSCWNEIKEYLKFRERKNA